MNLLKSLFIFFLSIVGFTKENSIVMVEGIQKSELSDEFLKYGRECLRD